MSQASTDSAESAPGKRAILLVDDDPPNRKLLRACLEGLYAVHEAAAAEEALDVLASTPIDLVLLDVMMPGMSGFELCRRIKTEQPHYLPVILLTALGHQGDRNAGLQAGADDFVTKPFDRHELLLRVSVFLKLRAQDQRIREQLEALREHERLIRRQMEELRAVESMKDDLVSLLVHDLRNPLTGITGFLDLLAEGDGDENVRNEASVALEASQNIRRILDDLLRVRMLESGSFPLHRELVRVEAVMTDAIASLWGAARARGVEVQVLRDESELRLQVDVQLVRRAIENLISNALKYSRTGSVVRVSIRRAGREVEIEVGDRGCGIPADFTAKVFQKFASVEAARGEARRGVGLGLYSVNLVATAHGGRVAVRERKHGGAAFSLFLPAPIDVER